ncbi:shikimate dehydrogenase [Chitinophaga silvatica]|uniref:Shikimate dehydrogenase n=1 Tax=Chitinophaga silvatica TaxID=2282649 RepID=A0A3E1Y7G0_9BACT|nr:shikimate dehydrogenase [Chitinophaga silvatica]RFS20976.1 shikimate dehydrogenase [Chitinophaga silvatica]
MKLYGLIGYPLGHSFSKGYFKEKFEKEHITDCQYENFPIPNISDFPALLLQHPDLCGLNVTIPYKEVIIPYLDKLTPAAEKIGAVNCIDIRDGVKTGYNTDVIGFTESLKPLLKAHHTHALILGTGGAAKAVMYALEQLGIDATIVSRQSTNRAVGYEQLTPALLDKHTVIINTTPLGMFPDLDSCPAIPFEHITNRHLLYDLVYNPITTTFLQRGAAKGASTKNGYEMLVLQAEASWEIWNKKV